MGFFRAIYYLFKNSPARRGVYFSVSDTKRLPKKFCSARWVENFEVCKTVQEVVPRLKEYVDAVKGSEKKPSCKSFIIVKQALQDDLLPAKPAFFQSIAEDIEPFLRAFQGDKPMVPFQDGLLF